MARHRSPRPTAPWSTLPAGSPAGAPFLPPALVPPALVPAAPTGTPAAGPVGGLRVGFVGARSAPSVPAHPLEPSSAEVETLTLPVHPGPVRPHRTPPLPDGPRSTGPRSTGRRPATAHRPAGGPATSGLVRSRLAVAAVAAGALATAGHGLTGAGPAPTDAGAATGALALSATSLGLDPSPTTAAPRPAARTDAATTGVLPVSAPATTRVPSSAAASAASDQVGSLSKSRRIADQTAARAAAAAAPEFVKPAQGRFTSGFGARWGTSHLGIDIANAIGTPIVSVGDGTVVESGPAAGFGMWVRVRLEDGTINVYGHVNKSFVTAGETVKAGQEIAEIGNRGQSTGPHLHFEVWTPAGKKINPLPWLAERGIDVGGSGGGGAAD